MDLLSGAETQGKMKLLELVSESCKVVDFTMRIELGRIIQKGLMSNDTNRSGRKVVPRGASVRRIFSAGPYMMTFRHRIVGNEIIHEGAREW